MTQVLKQNEDLDMNILVATTIAIKGECTRDALYKQLRSHATPAAIDNVLNYLKSKSMIVIDKNYEITWIFVVNEKLEKMHRESKRLI